jgi:hypothetical protein
MEMMPPSDTQGAERRVVLIDFDWQDADLIPELLRHPGISVGLVAGQHEEEAGLRVAEMCGMARTVELADLTREIFDLALVSERSARRTQVERLLNALGTPVASPQGFLETADCTVNAAAPPDPGNPRADHNGDELEHLLAQALPDLSDGPPGAAGSTNGYGRASPSGEDLPGPEDHDGLDRTLERWSSDTGARAAELRVGSRRHVPRLCHFGPEDALLATLIQLALESDLPQVVGRLDGSDRGRAWGAWPFHARGRRAILAAAAVDAVEGRAAWERMAQELRVAWENPDGARSSCAARPPRVGWLGVEEFRARLALAVERNRSESLRWTLHRLRFGGPVECVEALCRELPCRLRDSDDIYHPGPRHVLLLSAASPGAFSRLLRRLTALWEQAWCDAGQPAPAPPISEERIELHDPEDAGSFLGAAGDWLTGS